jgi:hypothetical protein
MSGETPRTEEFKRPFDWPDALIHLPFDFPDVAVILAALNGDPADCKQCAARTCGKPRESTTDCIASGSGSICRPAAD